MLDREVYLSQLAVFRASAAVVIRDGDGRVLLVEPTYKPRWELPGGAVEPDESPYLAAARELREELGLDLAVGRLLSVDHRRPTERNPAAMLHFLFAGPVLSRHEIEQIQLPPAELRAFRFVDPEDAPGMLGPRIGPRLRHAVAAADTDTADYLDEGHPPGVR